MAWRLINIEIAIERHLKNDVFVFTSLASPPFWFSHWISLLPVFWNTFSQRGFINLFDFFNNGFI